MNRVVPTLISEGLLVSTLFREAVSAAKAGTKVTVSLLMEASRQREAITKADIWLQERPPGVVRSFLDRIEPAQMTSVAKALCELADDLDGSVFRDTLRDSFRSMATSSLEHPTCDDAADVMYEAILRALSESNSILAKKASDLLFELMIRSVGAGVGQQLQHMQQQLDFFRGIFSEIVGHREQLFQLADTDAKVLEHAPPAVSSRAPRTEATLLLTEQLGPGDWIALNGSHGCGKTQLALQVAESLRIQPKWMSFRDMTIDGAEIALERWRTRTSTAGHDEQTLLVVDDFPRIEPGCRFESMWADVCASLASQGCRLLTLSTHKLPRILEERTTLARKCPIFSASEIGEYLISLGAPDTVVGERICSFYEALTQGNALLVRMMVDYLLKHRWSVSESQLTDLLQQKHAADISDQILRRVISTVPSDDARSLLFRLALWVGKFEQSGIEAASKVDPRIPIPGECVTQLRDTWIECLGNGFHRVVGTVKAVRPNPLPSDVQLATEEAFGDAIFLKKSVSPSEAFVAAAHYFAAKRYGKAATVLIVALSSISFQADIRADFHFLDFELPDETELVNLLPVLALQMAVGSRLARDTSRVRQRLMELLPAVREENSWAIVATAAMTVPSLSLCDPEAATQILELAVQWLPKAKDPTGKRYKIPKDLAPAELPLLGALFVQTSTHVVALIQTLRLVNQQAISLPHSGVLAELAVSVLTTNYVATERAKPVSERNWQQIRQTLQLVKVAAQELKWPELGATAARADILVLSEHMGDPLGARQLAGDFQAVYSDPSTRFLLSESVLRTHLHEGDWKSADEVLKELEGNVPADSEKTLLYATVDVGLASNDRRHAAQRLNQGRSLALKMPQISKLEHVRILGEISRASIEADDWQTAFESAELAMKTLETELGQPSEAWKACAVSLWHVGAYVAFCMQGLRTRFDVKRPPNGLMFTEDALAHLYSENRRGTAYLWHANMAEMVEHWNVADEWRGKGLAMVDSLENPDILRLSQVASLVFIGDFEGALAVCDRIGGPFSAHAGITTIVVPAMALHGLRLKEDETWTSILRAIHNAHSRLRNLEDAVTVLEAVAASLGHERLIELGRDKEPGLWATTALAASADLALPIQQALSYQLSVFLQLWSMFQQQTPIRARLALPFLKAFWDDALKRVGFAFLSPQHTRSELARTSDVHPSKRIRHVLSTIVSGLGGRLPTAAHTWLYADEA